MNSVAIYSERCWIDGSLQPATVRIENGIIKTIEKGKKTSGAVDAGSRVLMPGAIDVHVHVNEPGRTEWEGFDTATQAAAAGGITTIVDMPLNASPVTTTLEALEEKLQATSGKLHVNAGFYGGLVPEHLNAMEDLIAGGVLGFKVFLTHSGIDEFPNAGEKEIDWAMRLLVKYDLPVLAHCELSDAKHQDELSAHPVSYAAYVRSRPKSWENEAIRLMIRLCRKHYCKTHIVHVSSAEALDLIQQAKAEGLPVTAETCPHYIFFNAEDIPDAQTIYKCAPPVRERANNEKLRQALKNGILDLLASDHSPAPPALKEIESGDLQKAWGGIAGLQFLLSAGWTALKNETDLATFIPLLTGHSARLIGMDHRKGFLKEGYDADLVLWSPEESFVVKQETIFHKHKISPYVSRSLFGRVHQTYVNGELVFDNDRLIQKNQGQWLLRK